MIANFGNKIKQLINEATALKTTHLKTSSSFRTATQTVTLTFGLVLVDIPVPGGQDYSYVTADRLAYVSATSRSGQNMLASLTLSPSNSSLAGRQYAVQRFAYTGQTIDNGAWEIIVANGSADDIARLRRGETVIASIPVTVTATDSFTLSVKYQEIET